jgi:predicted HTH transcriptional regulator
MDISQMDLGELNQSIPRNRRIANVLYYHKLFESWGRGVRLIIDGCIEAGHPAPIYFCYKKLKSLRIKKK